MATITAPDGTQLFRKDVGSNNSHPDGTLNLTTFDPVTETPETALHIGRPSALRI